MARKFALYLKEDHEVRNNIEEITEYFDYGKLVEYFHDGSLLQWLEDRRYEDEAIAVSSLDASATDFKDKLCAIFHVDGKNIDGEKASDDLELIKKLEIVRQYTIDEKVLNNIEHVATNQDELLKLVKMKVSEIYLCADDFVIPLDIENVTYIGLGNPTAVVKSEINIDFEAKKIFFRDMKFDDEYEKICKGVNGKFFRDRLKETEIIAELLGVIINGKLKDGTVLWKTAGEDDLKKENFSYNIWSKEKTIETFPDYKDDCCIIGGATESHLLWLDTEYLLFTGEYMLIRDAQGKIKTIRYDEINNVSIVGTVFDDLKYELKDNKIEELHNSNLWNLKVGLDSIRLFLLLSAKIFGACNYAFTSKEMAKLSKIKLESLNEGNILDYLGYEDEGKW